MNMPDARGWDKPTVEDIQKIKKDIDMSGNEIADRLGVSRRVFRSYTAITNPRAMEYSVFFTLCALRDAAGVPETSRRLRELMKEHHLTRLDLCRVLGKKLTSSKGQSNSTIDAWLADPGAKSFRRMPAKQLQILEDLLPSYKPRLKSEDSPSYDA